MFIIDSFKIVKRIENRYQIILTLNKVNILVTESEANLY